MKELTVDLANQLISKEITVFYIYINHWGKICMTINIVGIEERPSKQIGQTVEKRLLFKMIKDDLNPNLKETDRILDYIYEWQGIFRITGSAKTIFVE